MKRLLVAIVVTASAGAITLGSAFAHGPGPKHPGEGRTMAMSVSGNAKLWILHVDKGCHSWSNGSRVAETVRLSMHRGAQLTILNEDVDVHQLVEMRGPRAFLGSPLMMMNHATIVTFRKAGVYHFKTRVVEMKGMNMMPKVDTKGPDHSLYLVVTVR